MLATLAARTPNSALGPPTAEEQALMEELRESFGNLPDRLTDNCSPSEAEWSRNIARLRRLIRSQDPREFLTWDVIERTMFVTNAAYLSIELDYLMQHVDWNRMWRQAIREVNGGCPPRHAKYPESSGTLIHHAYHVAQLMDRTGIRVEDLALVVEFGGGYGSMCRLFRNLGCRGRYVIFDFPELSALQRFYLKLLEFNISTVNSREVESNSIACVSNIEELKLAIGNIVDLHNALFIATWSLSEAPVSVRNQILPMVADFGTFLIAYQRRFGEVDNVAFFQGWKQTHDKIDWNSWEIEHLPRNCYLVGRRISQSGVK